jgi:hypothetical protein
MGDAGIEALTRALPQMASLMTLKLSSVASLLAGALPLMTALTTLDFSGAAGARLELPSVSGCYHSHGPRLSCGALMAFLSAYQAVAWKTPAPRHLRARCRRWRASRHSISVVHSRICVELRWDVPNALSLTTPGLCLCDFGHPIRI